MIVRTDKRARFLIFVVLVAAALALVVASWPGAKPASAPAKEAAAAVNAVSTPAKGAAAAAAAASTPAKRGAAAATAGSTGASSTQAAAAAPSSAGSYFVTALLAERQAQSRELALDQQVQADSAATASVRAAAAARIAALGLQEDQEAEIRALLLAKGYRDALVYLNGQPASAVVVLEAGNLTENDVLRAVDAVRRVSGVPAADISVMAHR